MHSSPDPLSRALGAWRLDPPRDPSFRAAVWSRLQIVRQERWVQFVRHHAAASFVALALAIVAGGWLGERQAQRQAEADREALAVTYLSKIDARVITTQPHHHHSS